MVLSSFPRTGQFVVSDYESRGGMKKRKFHKKITHKKKTAVRKTRRIKKIIL